MFPGGFVGEFGEFTDQFLKHGPHLGITDLIRVEIDVGELFCDQVQQTRLVEPIDLDVKLKTFEDIPD
jgi:hypothetical protein